MRGLAGLGHGDIGAWMLSANVIIGFGRDHGLGMDAVRPWMSSRLGHG